MQEVYWTVSEKQAYEKARQDILNCYCSITESSLNLCLPELRMLPPEIGQLQNLRKFSLKSHLLSALPPEIGQLQNLEEFVLSTARPTIVTYMYGIASTKEDFSQLHDGTAFKELPPEIGQLQNLRKLILSNNFISALPPEFGQLQNLQQLDLSSNRISALPPEFGQLQNLQQLNLSNNFISALPPEFGQLRNLRKLVLQESHLKSLPSEIGQLQNLQEFVLSNSGGLRNTYFKALPPELGQLQNLQQLDLSSNSISALPPEFGQLQNLQQLNLSSNFISALPSEFGQLQNLQQLDLSSNSISALPPEFGQLRNLKTLKARSNKLTVLPSEISQLQNLEILDLRDNPIRDLSALANHPNQALRVFVVGGRHERELPRHYWVHPSQWQPECLFAEPDSDIRCWAQAIYRETLAPQNPETPEKLGWNNTLWNVINPTETPGLLGKCTLNTLLYFGTDKLLRLEWKQEGGILRGVFFYDEQRLTLNENYSQSYVGRTGQGDSSYIKKRDSPSLPCSLLVKGILDREPWVYKFYGDKTVKDLVNEEAQIRYSFDLANLQCTFSFSWHTDTSD